MTMTKTKTKKKRAPRKKNRYFTKVHEDAIIQYASTDNITIRTELYIDLIEPAFDELVDKIVYTYKFNTLPNIDYLKDDCKLWLITILDKYDPNRKSKAFSYFSVITKNWFIHKVKQNSKKLKRDVQYEDLGGETDLKELIVVNTYEKDREQQEFWLHLFTEMKQWEKIKLKEIYLYMREITGLNTKQIVNNLNRIRKRYRIFKVEWEKGNI